MKRHVNGFENLRPRVEELEAALTENSKTIVFLAQQLGKALAQRDRARDLACSLEAELAAIKQIHPEFEGVYDSIIAKRGEID